jgi:hypothetical protein
MPEWSPCLCFVQVFTLGEMMFFDIKHFFGESATVNFCPFFLHFLLDNPLVRELGKNGQKCPSPPGIQ